MKVFAKKYGKTEIPVDTRPVIAFDWGNTLDMRDALKFDRPRIHPQSLDFLNILRSAGFRVVIISGTKSGLEPSRAIGFDEHDYIFTDDKGVSISNLLRQGHPHVFYVSDTTYDALEAHMGEPNGIVLFVNLNGKKPPINPSTMRQTEIIILNRDINENRHSELVRKIKIAIGFGELYEELKSMVSDFAYTLAEAAFIDDLMPHNAPNFQPDI